MGHVSDCFCRITGWGLSYIQVFLGPNGEVEEYSVISVQKNAAISSDLILDQNEEHLFIMTPNMVH